MQEKSCAVSSQELLYFAKKLIGTKTCKEIAIFQNHIIKKHGVAFIVTSVLRDMHNFSFIKI